VRESRVRIYTGLKSCAALTGLYGAVRGSVWSGKRHVTARPSHLLTSINSLNKYSILL
jgi:hypothetical protein